MNLGGLLGFIGLLLAIYGVAPPPHRVTIRMFAPKVALSTALVASLMLILMPDLFSLYNESLPESASFWSSLAAFLLPASVALWAVWRWNRAKLGSAVTQDLDDLIKTSLLEERFDELHRLLSANLHRLPKLPERTEALLFEPRLVAESVRSRSFIHLQLLSAVDLEQLNFARQVADITIRETLTAATSPISAWVAQQTGSDETVVFTAEDRDLMKGTLGCPNWYRDTRAGYPILLTMLEKIRSRQFDQTYNQSDHLYTAQQGRASRASCPLFIAEKTFLLAIEEAARQGTEGDFYVTDFLDLFRAILERTNFGEPAWTSSFASFPTPFTYLLSRIVYDLWEITRTAARHSALEESDGPAPVRPSQIANQAAVSLSFIVVELSNLENGEGREFATRLTRECIDQLLQIGYAPYDFCHVGSIPNDGLWEWYLAYVEEFARRLSDSAAPMDLVAEGFDRLDHGKHWVMRGKNDLWSRLGLN